MRLRSVIVGVLFTALLVVGLGVSRLLKFKSVVKEFDLRKIETLSLTPPPEPAMIEEIEELDEVETPSPPAPSFADLRPSLESVSIALPDAKPLLDPSTETDLFSLDSDPASLVVKVKPEQKRVVSPIRTRPKASVAKGVSLKDLDKMPSCISRGRFRWPSNVRSRQVKAVVKIELNANGRARHLSTVSVSDEGMRQLLPSIVNGSRFTAPTQNGQPLKVTFNWPLTLQKP